MNNHMYEHPATQANLAIAARARRARDRARLGRLASKGEQGIGRLAEPARLLEECEALLVRRRRGERALRRGLHGAACACWSPPAARASRSTACASSATAPRGAWAWRWREAARARGAAGDGDRRQRRACSRPRACTGVTWGRRRSCSKPARRSSRRATCC